MDEIDLGERVIVFAGEDRIGAVGRKIGVVDSGALRRVDVALQLHRVWIAEFESAHRLGDHDRRLAVRGEIEVVGIGHVDRLAELAGLRVDRHHVGMPAAIAIADVSRYPQCLQVPRRHDVLRARNRGQALDDLEGLGVDDVDLAGREIGRIDARQMARDGGAEHPRAGAGVDVLRVDGRRHRQVGRRQIDRLLRAELVGCERDEIALRPALFDDAAAKGGALRGVGAGGRDGQRLRRPERRVRPKRRRQSQSRDPPAQLHQSAPSIPEGRVGQGLVGLHAPSAMTGR